LQQQTQSEQAQEGKCPDEVKGLFPSLIIDFYWQKSLSNGTGGEYITLRVKKVAFNLHIGLFGYIFIDVYGQYYITNGVFYGLQY
jgi:hypothetical protein